MTSNADGTLQKLLTGMKAHGASDLHLKAGLPPYYRVGGRLRVLKKPPLSGEQIEACLTPVIPPKRREDYERDGNLDFSTELPNGERFRVNLFQAGGQMNATIRRVNPVIPSFEELGLPPVYQATIDKTHEGIILVCGVTGAGKSTTIAAMIEHVNATRSVNIVTLEDPVEFLFKPKKAIISQREIGIDVANCKEGLKYVVRQDPDVILIGEMRDKPTMTAALQAAETGHLVLGSLHTADTMLAFTRILEFFPREEHEFIRSAMASSLAGIFAQRLLPGEQEDMPLVPTTEVLLNTPTCRELIRKEQDDELPSLIASSEKEGMHSFTASLARLVEKELISRDVAMKYAPNAEALASQLRGITTRVQTMVQRVRSGGS